MTHQQDPTDTLSYEARPAQRPAWVALGLWGLPGRAAAWFFFWLCIAIAAFSAVQGFKEPIWFWGISALLAALWYWGSIRWVDRYGRWD